MEWIGWFRCPDYSPIMMSGGKGLCFEVETVWFG